LETGFVNNEEDIMQQNTHKPRIITLAIVILTTFLMLSCNLLNQAIQPTELAETETPTPAPVTYDLTIILRILEGRDMEERFTFTYSVDLTKPTEGNNLIVGESSGEFSGKYNYNQGLSCVGSSIVGGTFDFNMSAKTVQKLLTDLDPKVAAVVNAAAANHPEVISDGQISMFTFSFSDPTFEYTDKPEGMCLPEPLKLQMDLDAKLFPALWFTAPTLPEMYRSIPAASVDLCFDPISLSEPDTPDYLAVYAEICYTLVKK
jgi:hypothetical protein